MVERPRTEALRTALAPAVRRRSLWIAAVVGTILNAINQGDVVVTGGDPSWLKIGLTYCVPFCVATFGAYSAASVTLKHS